MGELLAIISLFWIPSLMVIWRNILWDVYIWQIKEYRFDRMIANLLNQEEDLKQSSIVYAIKVGALLLLILYLFLPQNDFLLISIPLTFGLYIFEALKATQETIGKRLIRPKISIRNILILGLSIIMAFLPYVIILYPALAIQKNVIQLGPDDGYLSDTAEFIQLLPQITEGNVKIYPVATLALLFSCLFILLIDLTTPLFVSFFVMITEPLSQFKRQLIIRQAKKRIDLNKNLKVVGITGSYGKTTTKEILYQILSKTFKTAKTQKNYNSAVGIAIAINENLKEDTEIFIAEMGAYTKGEVKWATEIAKPDISIVTGIDSQHLSLFGSVENIIKAKFEIIANAKSEATAILNGDNEYCLKMAEMSDKKTLVYFTSADKKRILVNDKNLKVDGKSFPIDTSLIASSIESKDKTLSFDLKYQSKHYKISTKIPGEHNVSNLLAAIGASLELGIKIEQLVKLVNDIEIKVPYLNKLNGLNNTVLIDDGYNANSTGFLSALKELKKIETQNRRFVFTKGIIELGWEKSKVYKKIAKELVRSADVLVTSDKLLIQTVREADLDFRAIFILNTDDFIKEFNRLTSQGDIILLEGPMPPRFLKEIIDID